MDIDNHTKWVYYWENINQPTNHWNGEVYAEKLIETLVIWMEHGNFLRIVFSVCMRVY